MRQALTRTGGRIAVAVAASVLLLAGSAVPANAATSGSASNMYAIAYVDLGYTGTYLNYFKVCDKYADGERAGGSAWSSWGTFTVQGVYDTNGANGTSDAACTVVYIGYEPEPGERIYVMAWRQNGARGAPHNYAEYAFNFG